MSFIGTLGKRWEQSNSLLCVGLDPDTARFPESIAATENPLFEFNKAIVDATHDLVCAYKPQISYFAAERAEDQLLQTIEYIHREYPGIPVILDAKRGDIGSTASKYALEAFERYGADAVTVNPYMGFDAIQPFTQYTDRGVIILCRTSNEGAKDFQDLLVDGEPLYQHVAQKVSGEWNKHGNCLLVVGATWPEQMAKVRSIVGDMPLLVPGVGAQGGDVQAMINAGQTASGSGLIVNSSRGVLYASEGEDFQQAAREAAMSLRDEINSYRNI